MAMRYVVVGAGAVGGLVAARLHLSGQQVCLVARGETARALALSGLTLAGPRARQRCAVPVVSHVREAALRSGDCVVLAVKTQDTSAALQDLAQHAPADIAVLCAQNGLENERLALRLFPRVYGMFVFVFSASLAPGQVRCYTSPSWGVLDLGRHPHGCDAQGEQIAADLTRAGFDSRVREDIRYWKAGKLLANLGNALSACYGDSSRLPDLLAAAQTEGRQCLQAAGQAFASLEEMLERRRHLLPLQPVEGQPFPGSSSWQSLARGAGVTEVDYLTGEIVLLGRQHGVPTPLNEVLQAQVRQLARDKQAPGSLDPALLRQRMGFASAASEPGLLRGE